MHIVALNIYLNEKLKEALKLYTSYLDNQEYSYFLNKQSQTLTKFSFYCFCAMVSEILRWEKYTELLDLESDYGRRLDKKTKIPARSSHSTLALRCV